LVLLERFLEVRVAFEVLGLARSQDPSDTTSGYDGKKLQEPAKVVRAALQDAAAVADAPKRSEPTTNTGMAA